MFVVLRYFIFLIVEVLLGGKWFPSSISSESEGVANDFLTLTASKLIKESTAIVAALLSA